MVSDSPVRSISESAPRGRAQIILEEGLRVLALGPGQALTYAREAAEEAQNEGDELLVARAYLLHGMALRRTGDLVSAQEMLDESEAILLRIDDKKYLPHVWQARASIFNAAGKLEEARHWLARALPMAREAGDLDVIQRILINWAVILTRQGDYSSAMQYLEEALTLLDTRPNEGLRALVLNSIGSIYQRSRNFETALSYFQQSLAITRAMGDATHVRHRCSSLICIADTLLYLHRYSEIPPYLTEALALAREHEIMDVQASVMKGYGDREVAQGNMEAAIPHFEAARDLLEATGNKMILLTVLQEIGNCYALLDNFEKAEWTYQHALQLLETVSTPGLRQEIHRRLAELYVTHGDHASATAHFQAALKMYEILFSESNQKVLRETEKRIAVESARREKQLLEAHAEEMARSHAALKELNDRQIEILRIVSHDMRNPLGAIVGMAGELVHDETMSIEEARDIGRVIEGSGQKLVLLTDQLLLAAQLESGALHSQRSMARISDVVDHSLMLIRPLATTKQIALECQCESGSGLLTMDVERVSHILNNLLSNAVKFTEAGGKVVVGCVADGEAMKLTIRDTGIGIPPELIDTLFTDFNAEKRSGTRDEKGTGLGLPLVKRLVELEGGTITVESEQNKGTTITVVLPLPSEHATD